MNKKKPLVGRLNVYLILVTSVCLMSAFLFYLALQTVSSRALDNMTSQASFTQKKTDQVAARLQKYVTNRAMSTTDKENLTAWVGRQKTLLLAIEKDGKLVYDYTDYDTNYGNSYSYESMKEGYSAYSVAFLDGEATAYLLYFYDYRIYTLVNFFNLVAAGILFIILLMILIRRKLRYIGQLRDAVQILEGGNLEYPVPVRGQDELSELAGSLNAMRVSFQEQIMAEKAAQIANRELITALSHDLRTPLTTQMGYLEILRERHYDSEKNRDRYLDKCISNCHQIKRMSDRLFEYFIAYDSPAEGGMDGPELEECSGLETLLQMITEKTVLLEESGFTFHLRAPEEDFRIRVKMDYLCRVFDNLFSNLEKYADKREPVTISLAVQESECILTFLNRARVQTGNVRSNGIGLASVKNLMKQQNGVCAWERSGQLFCLTLTFPTV